MSQNTKGEYADDLSKLMIIVFSFFGFLCLLASFIMIANFTMQAIAVAVIAAIFLIIATIKNVERNVMKHLDG
ncbi:MAG: hypothetical protein GPJ51_14775 [Candidatus Heimdallarchaeota archaeon]|nr:hypothetical protein [Candidatus Heimdallarchaeota archaeon]